MLKGKVVAKKMYDDERLGKKLVMYTTTNTVIRKTFDVCSSLLKLFEIMRLKVYVEENDAINYILYTWRERSTVRCLFQLASRCVYLSIFRR